MYEASGQRPTHESVVGGCSTLNLSDVPLLPAARWSAFHVTHIPQIPIPRPERLKSQRQAQTIVLRVVSR